MIHPYVIWLPVKDYRLKSYLVGGMTNPYISIFFPMRGSKESDGIIFYLIYILSWLGRMEKGKLTLLQS